MNKKEQQKILFISYDGMTDQLGQSQVIPYLQGISKNGYKVFLLSCEKKDALIQNGAIVKQLLVGYDIQWIPINYTKKPPVLSTIWDVIQLKRMAKKIHHQHQVDMVHTRPGIPALVGLWLKQTAGVKFLHDVREFYADSRVDGGLWDIKNPVFKIVYNYFKRKEAKQIEKCDGIVCLTNAAEGIIRHTQEYKHGKPLQVIPCSADLRLFDPGTISHAEKVKLQEGLGIAPGDFVVSYLGSVGGWYLTSEMLQFCKRLFDKVPNVKFLFIAPYQHGLIYSEAAKFGLPAKNLIVKKGKRSEIPALISVSNYSLFFIKPCYSKLSSSPTKHGEIMAMGIPVITNSGVGDVKDIVERYNGGFVVDDFKQETFDVVIDAISTKKFEASAIRNAAVEYYSLDNAVEKYTSIYQQILA